MSVYQIIYISAACEPFDEVSIAELLQLARTNNAQRDISGLLVFHEGSFIQVLEGAKSAVKDTFAKIGTDPRHRDVQVLWEGPVEERSFESWSMGYKPTRSIKDVPEGFHPFLVSGFRHNDETPDMARKALLAFREGRWRANPAAA